MSHKASAWAMDQRTKTPLEKLVLLILADCQNESTGLCYPSLTYICDKGMCSRQGAINVLVSLESQRLISAIRETGKSSRYTLLTGQLSRPDDDKAMHEEGEQTSKLSVLVNRVDPSTECTPTGQLSSATGQLSSKTGQLSRPEPGNNQEVTGKVNQEYKRARARPVLRPECVHQQIWEDFTALRTKLKAPITETALAGIEREAKLANLSLNDALRMCCERSWRGFKSSWIKPEPLTDPTGRFSPTALKNISIVSEYLNGN